MQHAILHILIVSDAVIFKDEIQGIGFRTPLFSCSTIYEGLALCRILLNQKKTRVMQWIVMRK